MDLAKRGMVFKMKFKRHAALVLSVILLVQGMVVYASPDNQPEENGQLEAGSFQSVSENQLEELSAVNEGATEENQVIADTEAMSDGEEGSQEEDTLEGESVSANEAGENGQLIEVKSPFEEDRYNPIYYGEIVDRWPVRQPGTSLYMTQQQEGLFANYILNAISNFQMEVDVSAYNIPIADMWVEIYHVLNAHPELFYVTVTSAYYNNSTQMVSSYILTYAGTQSTIETEKAKLNAEAEKALAYVDSSMSQYEKALAVHDYIVLNCEYDEENYSAGMTSGEAHSAYGALVNKIAVCDGYAKAYQYIMSVKLDIPCQVVTSSEMGHAWSLINIDGSWYHADLTWDDPVYDCIGRVTHDFFLLSDSVIGDSVHEHYSWQVKDQNKQDIQATSDKYKDYDWTSVSSAMFKQNGYWYYTKKSGVNSGIVKDPNLAVSGDEVSVYSISNEGNPAWTNVNNGCLARIILYENRLYFNTPSTIKSIAISGTDEKTEFIPEKTSNQFIYGFVIQNGNMKYALRNNTGTAGRQEVRTVGVASTSVLSVAPKDYNSLDITLSKVETAANASGSGYIIYRKTVGETEWSTAAVLEGASNTYYRDGGLTDSTSYTYMARNYQVINGDKCYGPYSNEVTGVTMNAAPVTWPTTQPVTQPVQQDKAVKGKTYQVGNYKYKVTTAANGKTGKVTFVAPVKKTYTKITVPTTVKIKNESYQVTAIAKNAFKNNKKLKSVTIGKNVTSIGSNAFYGCKKLKTVTIKSTKIKTIGKYAFKGIVSNATIKVPKSKLSSYKKLLKKKTVGLPSKVKIKKA